MCQHVSIPAFTFVRNIFSIGMSEAHTSGVLPTDVVDVSRRAGTATAWLQRPTSAGCLAVPAATRPIGHLEGLRASILAVRTTWWLRRGSELQAASPRFSRDHAQGCLGSGTRPDEVGYHRSHPMELRLLPYLPQRDVYRLLGVPPSADRAAIVAACRRLSRTFHPDRSASPRANEEMRVVNAVRSLLTDPAARAEYDRARLRFLSVGTRVAPPALPAPPRPPVRQIDRRRRSADLARTARAVMAGLLAGLAALAPPRCPSCHALVEREYRYCGACGRPLLSLVSQPPA